MSYVVKIDNDYIADGRNYTVQGESFVPITGNFANAKRYKTYKLAERASNRYGENMRGNIQIIKTEGEEKD